MGTSKVAPLQGVLNRAVFRPWGQGWALDRLRKSLLKAVGQEYPHDAVQDIQAAPVGAR